MTQKTCSMLSYFEDKVGCDYDLEQKNICTMAVGKLKKVSIMKGRDDKSGESFDVK